MEKVNELNEKKEKQLIRPRCEIEVKKWFNNRIYQKLIKSCSDTLTEKNVLIKPIFEKEIVVLFKLVKQTILWKYWKILKKNRKASEFSKDDTKRTM